MIFTYPLLLPSLEASFRFSETKIGVEVNLELPKTSEGFLIPELVFDFMHIFEAPLTNTWPQNKSKKYFLNLTIEQSLNDAYISVMSDISKINSALQYRDTPFLKEVKNLYYSHRNLLLKIL